MENENDQLPVEIEAQLELDLKPELKRGLASLRGVKRSTYMRRSVLRILSLSPEERAVFNPRNGFEQIALNLVNASGSKDRSAAVAVQVWREIKETLGERIGSNWRDTVEERERKNAPTIINDLPSARGQA